MIVLYWLNYEFTPKLVGVTELESIFRPKPKLAFNSVSWQHSRFGDGERYKMANYIVSHRLLDGMSETEVQDLLGQPDWWNPLTYRLVPQGDFPARSWLFPGFFFNFDNWILEVHIEGGYVVRTKVARS